MVTLFAETLMAATTLNVNGKIKTVDVRPDTRLLWVLRDTLGLTGTKYGCGMGLCGACTVHLDGEAVRSCQTAVKSATARAITTIEGLSAARTHLIQKAWIAEQVPQLRILPVGAIVQPVNPRPRAD